MCSGTPLEVPGNQGYLLLFPTSFDVRGRDSSSDGKHWSAKEPFGSRAFFRVSSDPTFLLINDVRQEVRQAVTQSVSPQRRDQSPLQDNWLNFHEGIRSACPSAVGLSTSRLFFREISGGCVTTEKRSSLVAALFRATVTFLCCFNKQ